MAAASSLRFSADIDRLADARAFVRSGCADLGASVDCTIDVVQAVDEALTNVAVHGYAGRAGPVELRLGRDEDRVVVTIEDRAPTFDPTSVPEPDLSVPPERRGPGGMGVHLIRAATDGMTHRERPGGGNVLTLVRTLGSRRTEDG